MFYNTKTGANISSFFLILHTYYRNVPHKSVFFVQIPSNNCKETSTSSYKLFMKRSVSSLNLMSIFAAKFSNFRVLVQPRIKNKK